MGKACHRIAVGTVAEAVVGRLRILAHKTVRIGRLQDLNDDSTVGIFGADGDMRSAVKASLVGRVEDLPIHKVTVSRKTDRARADAAYGKGDLFEAFSFVFHRALLFFFQAFLYFNI